MVGWLLTIAVCARRPLVLCCFIILRVGRTPLLLSDQQRQPSGNGKVCVTLRLQAAPLTKPQRRVFGPVQQCFECVA